MLHEVCNKSDSDNEHSFEAIPDSTFSWSELAFAPVEYQFGPVQGVKPSLMVVKRQKQNKPNTTTTSSVFDEIDVSAFVIQCAVKSAVYIKGTSIPDKITDSMETVVEFGSVMEQHYAIKRRIKTLGHVFISSIINVVTTFLAAILQFIIAYHNAPGRMENEQNRLYLQGRTRPTILDDSELVTFSVGGQSFTTKLQHLLRRKRSLLGRLALSRKSISEPVFVDRDPTHFRHIVNFLRGADSVQHIRDPQVLEDLLEDAEFYEMPDFGEVVLLRKSQLL